jgi:hypothetical protein
MQNITRPLCKISATAMQVPQQACLATKLHERRFGSTSSADNQAEKIFTPPWEGPFIVVEVLKSGTYKLANMNGQVYMNAWNVDLLRRFYA